MTSRRGGAGSPLFLRVFVLMVACVAITQLMNLGLLIAVQAPSTKVYSVGQIANAMRGIGDADGDFLISHPANVEPTPWNPRSERIELALARALQVPVERVRIGFPTPFMQREKIYDRASVPRAVPPASDQAARAVVIIGDFSAAFRRDDGQWTLIDSNHSFEPWRLFVLWWLILSAAAVAPFAWALAHRIAKPIGAFAEAAERLRACYRFSDTPVERPAIIKEIIR